MDLISKKAAIETLALNTDYQTPEGIKNDLINHPGKECDWLGGIDEAISIIEEMPSVPAVPLDKLCEMLSKSNVNVPCNDDCEGCEVFDGSGDTVNCWRVTLTKWMEGLDAVD